MPVLILLGACVRILANDDGTLQGIYFQDHHMKQSFSSYPEFVCIDATYKLLELRFSLYIMLIEEGNGLSEIVAAFLVLEETEALLSKIADIFKEENPVWSSVRVIMADKDMTEREVFAGKFPDAKLLICLFHTFRSFRREITVDKLGITSSQRDVCLDLLQQMAYAPSEAKYRELYEVFKDFAPNTVCEYFDANWHTICEQWTMGMKFSTGNFLNNTNNRLECFNSKLKSVITRYSSLEEFLDKFFLVLRVLRSEQDYKASVVVQKVPVVPSSAHLGLTRYLSFLTRYAYNFVSKQFSLMDKVKIGCNTNQQYTINATEGDIQVTLESCECMQWESMKLPCRHIFAVRSNAGVDLYKESLCDKRWTLSYYKASQRVFTGDDIDQDGPPSDYSIVVCSPTKKKPLSQVQLHFIQLLIK